MGILVIVILCSMFLWLFFSQKPSQEQQAQSKVNYYENIVDPKNEDEKKGFLEGFLFGTIVAFFGILGGVTGYFNGAPFFITVIGFLILISIIYILIKNGFTYGFGFGVAQIFWPILSLLLLISAL